MHNFRERWDKSSIKDKWLILISVSITIMILSQCLISYFGVSGLKEFEDVMENNSIYNELLEVIKEEQETFIAYIRNRSDENKIAYETAVSDCQECIDALPFDYKKLGEERYARTWNVISGYKGYTKYRDRMIALKETEPGYVDSMYEVLEMQESLSYYAAKLVEVTLYQWDSVYEEKIHDFNSMYLWILVIGILVFGSAILFWRFVSGTIIGPILMIAADSRKMAASEFDPTPLVVDNKDEIGDLVHAYNKMKETTVEYIYTLEDRNKISEMLHQEEMEKMELLQRFEQAQLEVLKSQVNPHFLFNTLNMISGMAKLEDAEVTDKMTVSLANLFRYNLRTVEQEVYLEQELAVVDDYIYIQQMRFDHRIRYEKIVEVDESKFRIPSFTLQPIVENAFVHGVSSLEEGGTITVHAWEEEGMLYIDISDNGVGIDEETLDKLNKKLLKINHSGRGIGLGNISRRIDMMYHNGNVKIYSEKGKGTTVRLVIPQNL